MIAETRADAAMAVSAHDIVMPDAHGPRRLTGADREAGLTYARDWREANRPYFDGLYGPESAR